MMTDVLQAEHFQPHLGKLVRFKASRHAFPLEEVVVDDKPIPPGMDRRPFLLIFSGPKEPEYLPEGLYDCEVEDGPTYRIYVSPIFTPEPDRQQYQAVFS
jgi:hypothetical protein